MKILPLGCACATLLLASLATTHAQVLRCEDAQGRITYTDGSCATSKEVTEVVPALTEAQRAQQAAQYQDALARKQAAQALQAERHAAEQAAKDARAAREAELAAQRPPAPVVVPVPVPGEPVYAPMYPPRPPHMHPAPPPRPQPQADGYNCNVFRCYDGKGNTWQRP